VPVADGAYLPSYRAIRIAQDRDGALRIDIG
jgi:hypothetical protein